MIDKRAADISLKRGEIKCDPSAKEINASCPEPGAAGVPPGGHASVLGTAMRSRIT
jgi:hypothetical protein